VVAHFDIKHGLATTNQLAVETSGATILGKGTINLATEGMELHLVPHATSAGLTDLAVPIIIGGTLANPKVAPDAAAIAAGAVKMPLTALNTIGDIAGIGGGDTGGGCGSAASQASKGAKQPASPAEQVEKGVGSAVKDVGKTLKSVLP
jgi:AsmA family protein